MVGDRFDTDILFDQNEGLATFLVLAGMQSSLPISELLIQKFPPQVLQKKLTS